MTFSRTFIIYLLMMVIIIIILLMNNNSLIIINKKSRLALVQELLINLGIGYHQSSSHRLATIDDG